MASYISCPVAPPHFSLSRFKTHWQDKGHYLALQFPKLIQHMTVQPGEWSVSTGTLRYVNLQHPSPFTLVFLFYTLDQLSSQLQEGKHNLNIFWFPNI